MKRTLIGVLTPSSNTVLEPLTSAMLAPLADVSAHFGRFGVTEISMSAQSQAQFERENQLSAAGLLADARVGAIVWSGTSASWLGFNRDVDLCRAITELTQIPAGSSVLAVNELFTHFGVKKFGLVSPYIDEIQQGIITNYAAHGLECVAERHLGESRNFEFSEFSEQLITRLILEVAESKPDAITVMCTNMRGAKIAPDLEQQIGIPVIDSTSAAVWTGLRLAGESPSRVLGWGKIFEIA
ncbi:MAG: aspartate/glutamate racemase family protein [Burkholderiaceae bacterium]